MRCKGEAAPDHLAALSAEARRIARALNATRPASGPRREIRIRIAAEMARPRRDPSAGMQKLRRRCALTSTEPPVRRLNIPTLLRGLSSRVPESEMRKSGRANSDAGRQPKVGKPCPVSVIRPQLARPVARPAQPLRISSAPLMASPIDQPSWTSISPSGTLAEGVADNHSVPGTAIPVPPGQAPGGYDWDRLTQKRSLVSTRSSNLQTDPAGIVRAGLG